MSVLGYRIVVKIRDYEFISTVKSIGNCGTLETLDNFFFFNFLSNSLGKLVKHYSFYN